MYKQIHSPLIIKLLGRKDTVAMAIWPFIIIKGEVSRTVIEHEKIHLRQQLNGWLIGFYIKYFYFQWKYGYENNPYEVEAYKHQNDWKQ